MSNYDEQAKLREATNGIPADMLAKLSRTFSMPCPAGECPKCGGVEWDHITSERGMNPMDLPINRCPCGHSWSGNQISEREADDWAERRRDQ